MSYTHEAVLLIQQVNGEVGSPCQIVLVSRSPRRTSKVVIRKPSFDSYGRWCSGDPKIDRLQTSCWRTTGCVGDLDGCIIMFHEGKRTDQ